MKKIVVCPDSFKGSINASIVAKSVSETLLQIFPTTQIIELPLADGGEGTGEIFYHKGYPNKKIVEANNPVGNRISSCYYISIDGSKAFIESAEIIGLPLISNKELNPFKSSSFGLGEVIKDAINNGIMDITVSLGGTATCDAGLGMLSALGFKFSDQEGKIIKNIPEKEDILEKIENNSDLRNVRFHVLVDVDAPLLGPKGAVYMFAPQKGALPTDLPVLENYFKSFSTLSFSHGYGDADLLNKKGAGAAGGLGFAFMAYLKAEIIKGSEFILETLDFENKIKDADLIITGEGKIDKQSSMGKVTGEVLTKALRYKVPVIGICGIMEKELSFHSLGFKDLICIADSNLSNEENMKEENTISNIKKALLNYFKDNSKNA